MSSSESPTPTPKPTASPFWKWTMRLTAIVTLLLFLTPTFYVLKYYTADKPREEKLARDAAQSQAPYRLLSKAYTSADDLTALQAMARHEGDVETQQDAIAAMERVLRQPGVSWKRPLECASAKATLAEAATKDPDPEVRKAASLALAKVAEGGAVLRR